MKITLKAARPRNIEMTLSITMTVSEWDKVQGQLSGAYPAWQVSSAISGLISKAHQEFEPSEEEPDGTPNIQT